MKIDIQDEAAPLSETCNRMTQQAQNTVSAIQKVSTAMETLQKSNFLKVARELVIQTQNSSLDPTSKINDEFGLDLSVATSTTVVDLPKTDRDETIVVDTSTSADILPFIAASKAA